MSPLIAPARMFHSPGLHGVRVASGGAMTLATMHHHDPLLPPGRVEPRAVFLTQTAPPSMAGRRTLRLPLRRARAIHEEVEAIVNAVDHPPLATTVITATCHGAADDHRAPAAAPRRGCSVPAASVAPCWISCSGSAGVRLARAGLDLRSVRLQLRGMWLDVGTTARRPRAPSNLDEFAAHLRGDDGRYARRSTAAPARRAASRYAAGMHVVTPNNRAALVAASSMPSTPHAEAARAFAMKPRRAPACRWCRRCATCSIPATPRSWWKACSPARWPRPRHRHDGSRRVGARSP